MLRKQELGIRDCYWVHIAGVGPGEGDGVFSGQREQRGFGVAVVASFWGGPTVSESVVRDARNYPQTPVPELW